MLNSEMPGSPGKGTPVPTSPTRLTPYSANGSSRGRDDPEDEGHECPRDPP